MIALTELAAMLGIEVRNETAGSYNGQAAGSDRSRAATALDLQPDPVIASVSSIGQAGPRTLVFAEDPASMTAALASPAAAILASPDVGTESFAQYAGKGRKPVLICAQPRLAFARAARLLAGPLATPGRAPDIHPTAVVGSGVRIAEDASIGPCAVLEEQASIGQGSVIGSGAVVGKGVIIGSRCHLYPRVVIYPGTTLGDRVIVHAGAVLGGDGFGYVRDQATGEYIQFPQQGKLIIEDDVEIGANTTIDRGALEETRIARGAKIDNLVHIGHNVRIGRNAVIAAQTGISGSSGVGDNAILGGQVGIGDHAFIGEGVILGGQGGVLPHKTLKGPGVLFWGTPAQPVKRYLRQLGALGRLTRSSKPGGRSSAPHDAPGDE
ncbi:MAG TPA: UDP-3-O-(3-hydroxymyristoyl)glucosamine N-acyltransferase [Acidobacteriaceae bacterium]|nr:UDP-3-O-(3-hydroxymyristoyl)glucosamine N-acyltransferase [Acidobacteriaceae bacterium]